MIKRLILLDILLTIISTNSYAGFDSTKNRRGEFTSDKYIMYHERNDYKSKP